MRRVLLLLLTLAGCHTTAAPPTEPVSSATSTARSILPTRDGLARMAMAQRLAAADAGPADAGPAAVKSLDDYAAFSSDGLIFAYAIFSSDLGVRELRLESTTTHTDEKTIPLDVAHHAEAVAALRDENLPAVDAVPPVPKQLGVDNREGRVLLTFAGMPASKTYEPFPRMKGVKIDKVDVVAASPDGKRAAVRIVGTPPGGTSGLTEFHVFSVFE